MISYQELNAQTDKITELSNVLSVLLKDRSICDSETCCKIFYNYMDHVNKHMQFVESSLYPNLLSNSTPEAKNTASNFLGSSQGIKLLMSSYKKKWCNTKQGALSIGNKHDQFIADTDDMFATILTRLQDETENLYPIVRKISNG